MQRTKLKIALPQKTIDAAVSAIAEKALAQEIAKDKAVPFPTLGKEPETWIPGPAPREYTIRLNKRSAYALRRFTVLFKCTPEIALACLAGEQLACIELDDSFRLDMGRLCTGFQRQRESADFVESNGEGGQIMTAAQAVNAQFHATREQQAMKVEKIYLSFPNATMRFLEAESGRLGMCRSHFLKGAGPFRFKKETPSRGHATAEGSRSYGITFHFNFPSR